MITFLISFAALILGYFVYGRFVEHVFRPDDRPTPAVTCSDGLDYVSMPYWKIFMIQFLNIAGTGPIFGAIMGAKFGPVAYLWIVLGCVFAGAMHDYFSGMLSIRNKGVDLPITVSKYLGNGASRVLTIFTIFIMLMVGAVFVYSPAEILGSMVGSTKLWMAVIFIYYIIATMLPIDKIIGKIYPIFAFSLLFMAVSLFVMLFVKMPNVPELWDEVGNLGRKLHPNDFTQDIFPALFITISCGAISGFHATQSPLMARCMPSERKGRPIFYGAMITEGLVTLVWATIAMWFFYDAPQPGYMQIAGGEEKGYLTSAPVIVNLVCNDWLGVAGGILALLGVVAAPITTGDTALRTARLIVAQLAKLDQKPIMHRLYICIPLFAATFAMLIWQSENPDGFSAVWRYLGWANQTLSVFTLWTISVYLAKEHKPYIIALVPAVFMTAVCTFFLTGDEALHLTEELGIAVTIMSVVVCLFFYGKMLSRRKPKEYSQS